MDPERKEIKLIYAGRRIDQNNSLVYQYYELDSNFRIAESWTFRKKIFTKGSVGSIFNCARKEDVLLFHKSAIPSYWIPEDDRLVSTSLKFEEVKIWDRQDEEAETIIRNKNKPKSEIDLEVEKIKSLYKKLSPNQRSYFISDLIYKITN